MKNLKQRDKTKCIFNNVRAVNLVFKHSGQLNAL